MSSTCTVDCLDSLWLLTPDTQKHELEHTHRTNGPTFRNVTHLHIQSFLLPSKKFADICHSIAHRRQSAADRETTQGRKEQEVINTFISVVWWLEKENGFASFICDSKRTDKFIPGTSVSGNAGCGWSHCLCVSVCINSIRLSIHFDNANCECLVCVHRKCKARASRMVNRVPQPKLR